jgi:glycosyltransferase involved in cell wall biosynthesis
VSESSPTASTETATSSDSADRRGLNVCVHTCVTNPASAEPWRKNFTPHASAPLGSQQVALPPIAEVLEWADRQQFDVIHTETFGPMGLLAWIAAKMLRVPFVAAFQVDLPGMIRVSTGDFRLGLSASGATGWFYQQANNVLTRSRSSQKLLQSLGVNARKLTMLPAEFDASLFDAPVRDPQHWQRLGVREAHTLLYAGDVSIECNLRLLSDAFEMLCTIRRDVALVVVGDGPYLSAMQKRLMKLPAYFNPGPSDVADKPATRAANFAASDLLVFPSAIECAAQTVIEAQACGLPVLVSDQGASSEMMDDAVSGMVLSASKPREWADAINALLNDELRRQRMSRTAPQRMSRFARSRVFDTLWDQYASAVAAQLERSGVAPRPEAAVSIRHAASDMEVTTS